MKPPADKAPAATESVKPGADEIASRRPAPESLSLTRAAKRFGLNRHTLRAAVDTGKIRAERIERAGLGPDGVGFLFDPHELQEDLAALPACRYPGCDRFALGASGACEAHGHVFLGLRARGVRRPDIGPKISASKIGKPRPDQSERIKDSLRAGSGAWAVLIDREWRPMKGRTKSRYKGRWAGQAAGKHGGRKRGYSELQAKGIRALKQQDPNLGIRRLAQHSGLTVKQVRAILTAKDD